MGKEKTRSPLQVLVSPLLVIFYFVVWSVSVTKSSLGSQTEEKRSGLFNTKTDFKNSKSYLQHAGDLLHFICICFCHDKTLLCN